MAAEHGAPPAGSQDARPGRLRPEARPTPDEIVCIAVDKVYDYCFDETTVTRCVPFEGQPAGTRVTCALRAHEATCRLAGEVTPGEGGLASVNVVVTVPATVTVGNSPEFAVTFPVFRSLRLCIPEGTQLGCEVTGTAFGELIDTTGDGYSDELCCVAHLCVVLHTTARVRLLVPSYGLCAPGPAREAAPVEPRGYPAGCHG